MPAGSSLGRLDTPLVQAARWSLTATLAIAPLFVVRWHVGPIPTTLLENALLLTMALYLGAWWTTGRPAFVRVPYDVPILLLLLAGAIAIFVAPNHRAALGLYRAYLIEPAAIYYVAIDLLRRPPDFKRALLGLGVGGAGLALVSTVIFIRAYLQGPIDLLGAPSAYSSPNAVAMYLEPLIAIGVGFLLFAPAWRERVVALGFLLILVTEEILTFSRAGYLALAVMALIVVVSMRRRLLWLAAVVVGGVLLTRVPLVSARLAHQLDPHYPQNTFIGRLGIWTDTLHMLRDRPLFGAGLFGYQQVVRPYVEPGFYDEIYPHNLWLTFWSELGLLGLAAFSWLFFGLLLRGWRATRRATSGDRPVLWGLSTALVMIGVHGLFDQPIWKNDLALEFFFLAALLVAATRSLSAPRPEEPASDVTQARSVAV